MPDHGLYPLPTPITPGHTDTPARRVARTLVLAIALVMLALAVLAPTRAAASAAPASGYSVLPAGLPAALPGPNPVVTSISAEAGSTTGGLRVTITGAYFAGTTDVLFGGIRGTDIRVASDGELSVTTPARAEPGNVNVRVFTVVGRSIPLSPVHFRFIAPPTLTEISPSRGSDAGGSLVTIVGTDLGTASAVTFGGIPAKILGVTSTSVRVLAPARAEGGISAVQVSTIGGTTAVVPPGGFTYVETPAVTSLAPEDGPTTGGSTVTLHGSNLRNTTRVTFGGRPGTNLAVISDSELTVTAPPRTAVGDVLVAITTGAGITTQLGAASGFTYTAPVAAPVDQPKPAHSYWPLGLIGILSWTVWFVRRFLSRHRYSAVVNDYRTTTSVVVPVYQEDTDVLERCLKTWLRDGPTEVILVVDNRDDTLIRHLRGLALPTVKILPWRHTGKRGALGAGVREATGDVIVFADSDTEWRPGLLGAIQMPFIDPSIGGVGSRQHVYMPRTNVWRRVAYWMLNTRYLDYVPAMSRRGGVACLSGRTAAYRRSIITPLMPALEKEIFLGRECIAGDDGRLTWLVLASGYKTVHQDTAQADSMFPSELTAFIRQRIRWSRNSYRCYLTALSHGWLWRQPIITQVTVLQILLTPISMGAAIWYGAGWIREGGWVATAIVLAWAVAGRALRGASHLMENPREIVMTPLVATMIAVIALPIKLVAGLTMNRQGWLTRVEGQRVQGQGEIEVVARASQL